MAKTKISIVIWTSVANVVVSSLYTITIACVMSEGTERWSEILRNGGGVPYAGFILNIIIGVSSVALFILACALVGSGDSDNKVLSRNTKSFSILLIALSVLTIWLKAIALCVDAEYLFFSALLPALSMANIILLANVVRK